MNVLVACEYSGIVRDAFIKKGHNAVSCDILPSESDFGEHFQCDIFTHLEKHCHKYDLMIAHPPCTYLSNSGVCWLYKQIGRWEKMKDGAIFFKTILEYPIPKIAVENPIMHKYAKEIIGKNHTQIIQPYMFGHAESKATCLWLKELPKLIQTDNVFDKWKSLPKREAQRLHYLPPGPNRARERSKTFQGVADAMADQWG